MLIVVMGTTGVGKDKLVDALINQGCSRIVRPTTRPNRGEEDEERYNFIGIDTFAEEVAGNKIVIPKIFNQWYYGIYNDIFYKMRDREEDYVISLDRLSALELYHRANQQSGKSPSKQIFFVAIGESDTKEKALERILSFRKAETEEEQDFIRRETARRLETDAEDTLNTYLLGANLTTTSKAISTKIRNNSLDKFASKVLDEAKTHWIEMEDIKNDFDF